MLSDEDYSGQVGRRYLGELRCSPLAKLFAGHISDAVLFIVLFEFHILIVN